MAHELPPKAPNSVPLINWLDFGHHHRTAAQPSWVDEFLEFSSAKRSAHRRSVSYPVTFLETAAAADPDNNEDEFDRLDDDQLMSMFSDDTEAVPAPPSSGGSAAPVDASAAASSPSDNNSINEEKTTGGASTASKAEEAQSGGEPLAVDPKKVKRILANRQSAQRSRVRKLQYISELERSVSTLQAEVSALSPRVALLDHQRSVLTVGNSHLKQRIAALAQDNVFKDAHHEALKKEIERLRDIYHQQSLHKKMTGAQHVPPPPPAGSASACPAVMDKDEVSISIF